MKLKLLKGEGVEFTEEGRLMGKDAWFSGPFDIEKGRMALPIAIKAAKGKQ